MKTQHFQLFHGEASDTLADLYLDTSSAETTLQADVRGPYCSLAKTLTTTTSFQPYAENNLWRARIVDPCFWSPDYPALYRVTVQGPSQKTELSVGMRHFGCSKQSFRLNGKRWVLRAATAGNVGRAELAAWREARMTMRVRAPSRELLDESARLGVMLMVEMTADRELAQLDEVARCAAAAIVIVPNSTGIERLRPQFRNVVFMKQYDRQQATWEDADAVLCRAESEMPNLQTFGSRPVVALRDAAGGIGVQAARTACDRLQRDLAPAFDLSGYIV